MVRKIKKEIIARRDHSVSPRLIDEEVAGIIRRLHSRGFEAYLVGGCVRDLLLKRSFQDHDIVTDARPDEIKRIFRSTRLIGRRFKLAHVYIGRSRLVEIATFRGASGQISSSVPHLENNTFGTMEEDALRRDFTANALFFDLKKGRIIDYTGAMKDLKKKVLRSIRPSSRNYREDPVRILRACRFSAQLGLRIPFWERYHARKTAPLLKDFSPSRMLEELRKILKSGYSEGIFKKLHKLYVLKYWIPELNKPAVFHKLLKRLAILDKVKQEERLPGEPLQFSFLLYDLLMSAGPAPEPRYFQVIFQHIKTAFRDMAIRIRLPKILWNSVCEIAALQVCFSDIPPGNRAERFRKRLHHFDAIRPAIKFLELDEDFRAVTERRAPYWSAGLKIKHEKIPDKNKKNYLSSKQKRKRAERLTY